MNKSSNCQGHLDPNSGLFGIMFLVVFDTDWLRIENKIFSVMMFVMESPLCNKTILPVEMQDIFITRNVS